MLRLLGLIVVTAMFAGLLTAQQDIDVQYPVGTSIPTGGTVDFGDDPSKTPIMVTIRIENVGTGTNLVLDTTGGTNRPCDGVGASRVDWNITQPATTTLAPGASVDFSMTMTANAKGKWHVFLYVYSDDPDEAPFILRFQGSAGKEKKDESCSTSESGNFGFIMLLGAMAALGVGIRLRSTRG